MKRIVSIAFRTAGKTYDFAAGEFELKQGDPVIVETDRGRSLGTVVHPPKDVSDEETPEGLKSVLRHANDEDLAQAERYASMEQDAYRFCLERIQHRQMEMKLVRAEYLFDGSKIIFYFTADGRVDFRELVRDLAHHFRARIEMRQIGVRDEAKQVGGLGVCGRELCCCTFLRGFAPISVKMAKEQGLALNPTKISGQCGRLLCCLDYEFETYCSLRKGLPKVGKKISYQGATVDVVAVDVIAQRVTLRLPDNSRTEVTVETLKQDQDGSCCGKHQGAKPSRRPERTEKRPEKKARDNDTRERNDSNEKNGKGDKPNRPGRSRNRRRKPDGEKKRPNADARPEETASTEDKEQKPTPDGKDKPRRRSRPRRRPRKKPNRDPQDS